MKVVVSVERIRDESQNFRSLRTIRYGAMSWGNIYKYARDGLPRVLRTLAMTCIKPGMTHGKEIPGQAGDDERNREDDKNGQ